MAWRGLHISRPATLTLDRDRVAVEQDGSTLAFPLEDVAWIVLDTRQVMLSGPLLAACMEAGVMLVSSDARHMPCGVALPFHGHHRQAGIGAMQMAVSASVKKRLWQRIVRRKIANQAALLAPLDPGAARALGAMTERVRSGDPDNIEAQAARAYWARLWPDFTRGDGTDRRNALLDYGYAVVRAALARALVAHGLLPAFGLRHSSVTNAFNLADDLIEAFRPHVDAAARERWLQCPERTELDLDDRRAMAGVLNRDLPLAGETAQLLTATERAAASLVRAFEAAMPKALVLPGPPAAANAG